VQRTGAFLVNFASLRADGGVIPALKVAVCRQYPIVYMHPGTSDPAAPPAASQNAGDDSARGSGAPPQKQRRIHCNQRSHDLRMRVHERLCEQRIERLQNEYIDRQSAAQKLHRTRDEIEEEEEDWANKRRNLEADLQELHKQILSPLKVHLCELGLAPTSSIAATGAAPSAPWSGQCCIMTVWRPTEEHRELLTPGRGTPCEELGGRGDSQNQRAHSRARNHAIT
jgi:hypothetical protein